MKIQNQQDKVLKVAITGKIRSGKSTVTSILEEELREINDNIEVVQVGFGDMLKYFAHDIFLVEYTEEKPRKLYQEFGQAMRHVSLVLNGHENVWVNLLDFYTQSLIDERADDDSILAFIITDLRQPNEFDWCLENGYQTVKVLAPQGARVERMKQENDNFSMEDLEHETETHVNNFETTFTVNNDDNMEYLQSQVKKLALEIYSNYLDSTENE